MMHDIAVIGAGIEDILVDRRFRQCTDRVVDGHRVEIPTRIPGPLTAHDRQLHAILVARQVT